MHITRVLFLSIYHELELQQLQGITSLVLQHSILQQLLLQLVKMNLSSLLSLHRTMGALVVDRDTSPSHNTLVERCYLTTLLLSCINCAVLEVCNKIYLCLELQSMSLANLRLAAREINGCSNRSWHLDGRQEISVLLNNYGPRFPSGGIVCLLFWNSFSFCACKSILSSDLETDYLGIKWRPS